MEGAMKSKNLTKRAQRSAVAYFRTSSATNVGPEKDSLKRQREAVLSYAESRKI